MFLSQVCPAVSAVAQPHFSIIFLPMSMVAARIYVLKASIVQLRWQVEWRPSSWQENGKRRGKRSRRIKEDQAACKKPAKNSDCECANDPKNVVSFTMDHMNGSL